MAQVRPTTFLSLQGFPEGQGYLARTRTVPDLTVYVRQSDRYKPQWYRNDQFPHRGNAYFYFSPQYYYNLHPHRYATPCRDLTPFKYDTHWADYKGAWFDYLEWFHYKRWYNPFYDMSAYHANLIDNYG
ncbi:unnamed protein product [Meloidogyne enterolobii]|uniref:Uncharacterized protein n=1 Tax=Meloidogyne enterolobii TaxID=390850 RepID=A0ACB0Z740_MELEN